MKNSEVINKYTAICTLTMKNLTDTEIENYVKLDSPLNSCASYKFEENGYKLHKEVMGSLESINGLPFKQLRDLAKILAIVVFPTPLIPVNKNALGILFNEIDFLIVSTIIL